MMEDLKAKKQVQYTDLQQGFIEEYLLTGDPLRAALNAGYPENTAKKLAADFLQMSKIINAIDESKKVEEQLIDTWQPVAAIATRSGVSVRATLNILVRLYNRGTVKMSYSRIDGHNKVHMFKKIETQKIMGVYTVIESDVIEL